MELLGFSQVPQHVGLILNSEHTIVEKWPMRLKLSLPHPGAQEEFNVLLASGHNGGLRYVEWRRDIEMGAWHRTAWCLLGLALLAGFIHIPLASMLCGLACVCFMVAHIR